MMPLPADLTLRTYRPDDLPAVVALINRCWAHDGERGQLSEAGFAHLLSSAIPTPEANIFVVTRDDGGLVACGFCVPNVPTNQGAGQGYVDPTQRGRGIGAFLLRHTDAHFLRGALLREAADARIYVHRYTSERAADAVSLLEGEGYQAIRWFYTMETALDTPRPPVTPPDGLRFAAFDPARDAEAVYAVYRAAFTGHFGAYKDLPFARFCDQFTEPTFRADWWTLAYADMALIGFAAGALASEDQPDFGWLRTVAVRPDWGGRGVGSALVAQALHTFQQAGCARAGVSVDRENAHNAGALYERAGMQTTRVGVSYRKVLPESEDA